MPSCLKVPPLVLAWFLDLKGSCWAVWLVLAQKVPAGCEVLG